MSESHALFRELAVAGFVRHADRIAISERMPVLSQGGHPLNLVSASNANGTDLAGSIINFRSW
jgi:hypothetical protein